MNIKPYAKTAVISIIALIITISLIRAWINKPQAEPATISASYACEAGKIIVASYEEESVTIALSDGRGMTLSQGISASGARYVSADESLVFWNKGNGAFITERGAQTFTNCIEIAKDPGELSRIYIASGQKFSIRYPFGFTPAPYLYQALGPGKEIDGIEFMIASSTARGTNLSADSYVSIETLPEAKECSASLFLVESAPIKTVTENGIDYSFAQTMGAGAGNRYEETVYAIPGTSPCIAIRYFIHYGAIENYPAGAVREFDKSALLKQFDAMRSTLFIAR